MNSKIIGKVLLSALIAHLGGSAAFGGAGTTVLDTLKQPGSASSAARAEASSALTGLGALPYNPAGLYGLGDTQVSVMYQRGMGEDTLISLLAGKEFEGFTLGAGVSYYTTGDIEMYTPAGQLLKETGQKDTVISLSAAAPVRGVPAGITLKMITSSVFGESGSAFAADIGARPHISENICAGLSLQNIGSKISYIDEEDPLPAAIRPGLSYRGIYGDNTYTLSMDIPHYLNESVTMVLIGGEFNLGESLSFRGGYRVNLDETEAETIVFGAGFKMDNYTFDYAAGLAGDLDMPHRVSLSASF